MQDALSSLHDALREHELLIYGISWWILGLGILQNLIYLAQLPAAWLELRTYSQAEDSESSWQMLVSDITVPVTLLVPAYNEEAGIVQNVHAMLALEYPDVEVIVINDGSNDKTLGKLIETFSLNPVTRAFDPAVPHKPVRRIYGSPLHPHLHVIDKDNGGKADAINAGINFCRNPLFCVVDGDSLLESAALLRAIRPFMEDPRRMAAVGGTIRVANGCEIRAGQVRKISLSEKFLPLVQTMEYIRAFLIARLALSRMGVLTIISGAFGIFRRSIAVEVGGLSPDTVGEDFELVIKIHRYLREQKRDYAMRYVPEPVCWTEAPETWRLLGRQRARWSRGALEVFFKYGDMLLNPSYGRIGMIGFLYMLLIDVLGPATEMLGYILVPLLCLAGLLNIDFLLAYMALTFVFGMFFSTASLVLEEMELHRVPRARDLLILTSVAVLENLGYRQINNVWRMIGWWQFICGNKAWGEMKRRGLARA
jgi:cellulose synthase/poly-beta-1,6-N-acetylglucosamine synthase-like glycosyltransferase